VGAEQEKGEEWRRQTVRLPAKTAEQLADAARREGLSVQAKTRLLLQEAMSRDSSASRDQRRHP